ncbi:MAG: hypothetical protein ACKVOE_10970 [Rickettsiales bacterium]
MSNMNHREANSHPVARGAFWGAAVGGATSAAAVNFLDELAYFVPDLGTKKFNSTSIKAVVAVTLAGAAIGAFVSAQNHKAWSDRVDVTTTSKPLGR